MVYIFILAFLEVFQEVYLSCAVPRQTVKGSEAWDYVQRQSSDRGDRKTMKKRVLAGVSALLLCMTALFGGCGANEGERVNVADLEAEKYVTLGEYKGMELTCAPLNEVTEEELQEEAWTVYESYVTEECGGVTDRPVENGDKIVISFVGKVDGEEFVGGTSDYALLHVGAGHYIPGFEEGLVGVMPGETVDLNLKFPDDYGKAELAGQDAVFTVNVKFIMPVEMADEVIASMGAQEYTTVDEYMTYFREALEESEMITFKQNAMQEVVNKLMMEATFTKLPNKLVKQLEAQMEEMVLQMAIASGVDSETFISDNYGMELDSFLEENARYSAQMYLACQAVADREGLNLSEEELDVRLKEKAELEGYASVPAMLALNDKEALREDIMCDDVIDFLIENAVFAE